MNSTWHSFPLFDEVSSGMDAEIKPGGVECGVQHPDWPTPAPLMSVARVIRGCRVQAIRIVSFGIVDLGLGR